MPSPHDRPVKPGDYVYLIDGSGFIFRAYHALPPLNRRSDGLPLNAVLGFCNMLNKLLREIDAGERPSHIAVVFDKPARSFRSAIYKDYKAHRPEPPSDLVPQFGIIRQAVKAFAVPASSRRASRPTISSPPMPALPVPPAPRSGSCPRTRT